MKRTMTAAERRHLARVAAMGCIACEQHGYENTPAEVHHVHVGHGWGRTSHYATIPLCPYHHRHGPLAVHFLSRAGFTRAHGMSELRMLALVHVRLGVTTENLPEESTWMDSIF
jgi:hypothetical protein